MVMSRWDPFGEALSLRDAMNHLFEQAVLQPEAGTSQRGQGAAFAPALDVQENADEYTVKASLPGVKPEDVQVQIQQGVLSISGEMHEEQEQQRGSYHIRERRQGRFARTLTLPAPVNAERVDASFENGVLTLRLPKAEQTKPRRIQVRGDSQSQIEAKATSTGNGDSGARQRGEDAPAGGATARS